MEDFSKFIEPMMILMYEVRNDGSRLPRWDYKSGSKVYQDYGYTDQFAPSFVEIIAKQTTDTHVNTTAYVRLINDSLYAIPYPDHIWYDSKQWKLPGFFSPVGGWGFYLNRMKIVECSCGAIGYAKATNQGVTVHGPLCQITQEGL